MARSAPTVGEMPAVVAPMSSPFAPAVQHRALMRLQARLERWLEAPEAVLFRAPEVGWSPGEHLYHVGLANEFALKFGSLHPAAGAEYGGKP